jgi:LysR family transcriptional regulator, glycine cleavage system transcriptional activator
VDKLFQQAPLIHTTSAPEDWDWWFKQSNIQQPRGNQNIKIDTMKLATDAAVQGLGIALGRKPLVDDEVAAGRLVEIAGPPRQGPTCYWLVGEEATFNRAEAKLFRSWLIDEMQTATPAPRASRPEPSADPTAIPVD